jgi:CRISPR/Cas system CMR-associated protein Cmr5 small subunit
MGLQAVIQKAAKTAFNVLGDLKTSAIYKTKAPGTYDPSTGTAPDVVIKYALKNKATLTNYKRSETDGEKILSSDRKAILIQSDFSDNNLTPLIGAFLILNGVDYRIINISEDPAKATFVFQLRAV